MVFFPLDQMLVHDALFFDLLENTIILLFLAFLDPLVVVVSFPPDRILTDDTSRILFPFFFSMLK